MSIVLNDTYEIEFVGRATDLFGQGGKRYLATRFETLFCDADGDVGSGDYRVTICDSDGRVVALYRPAAIADAIRRFRAGDRGETPCRYCDSALVSPLTRADRTTCDDCAHFLAVSAQGA